MHPLLVMASYYLLAMASYLLAMASYLLAMTSKPKLIARLFNDNMNLVTSMASLLFSEPVRVSGTLDQVNPDMRKHVQARR